MLLLPTTVWGGKGWNFHQHFVGDVMDIQCLTRVPTEKQCQSLSYNSEYLTVDPVEHGEGPIKTQYQ